MEITEQSLKNLGFEIIYPEIHNGQWITAEYEGIFIQKRPNEDWSIGIEYDHDSANVFRLTDISQILHLIKALI